MLSVVLDYIHRLFVLLLIPVALWGGVAFLLNSGARAEIGIIWLSTPIAVVASLIGLAATWLILGFIYEPR